MGVIVGKGILVTFMETVVKCPVCTFEFDCSEQSEKSKLPLFKMKCPACKSKLGILIDIFGHETKCFEYDCPKNVERLETTTNFTVNKA